MLFVFLRKEVGSAGRLAVFPRGTLQRIAGNSAALHDDTSVTLTTERPLHFLEEAVRRAPREITYRTLLAEACLLEGDHARAIEILASSLDSAAKPRTIFVLALALLTADRHGEAKSAATEAIRLNPGMDRAFYVRGMARRAQGDLTGALADLRAAAENRHDAEYSLALARTAIEAASSAPATATREHLKSAILALDAVSPTEAGPRERQHLVALLAFALDEPGMAVARLRPQDPSDPKLGLLHGLCLLATGRGAEATKFLNSARGNPETSAAASRFLAALRERGTVRPSLTEVLLAAGSPAWPDLRAIALRLLPPPTESWPLSPDAREPDDVEDAIDLDFDLSEAPAPRAPGSATEGALERARSFLAQGRHDAAVRELEHAWEAVSPGTSPIPTGQPVPRRLLQALAEALAAAYEQSSPDGAAPRRVRGEELYAAGARYPGLLRSLVRKFAWDEPREDRFALDVLVTAIEIDGAIPKDETLGVLARLSTALRLDLEDDPAAVQERVPLLERLHRARPGLAFPRLYLGQHAIVNGDPERALAFLADIAGPLAESPHVLILRAACIESLGEPERALGLYREAHSHAPQLPGLNFRIGRVLLHRVAAEKARPREDRGRADASHGSQQSAS